MTALFALTLAMLAPGAEPVPLQWKLAKGDVFYVKTVTTLDKISTLLGRDTKQNQELTTYQEIKVLAAGEKGYKLQQTTLKWEVKGNLFGVAAMGEKMQGMVFTISVNEKFEITKVEGVDKLIEKVAGDNDAVKKAVSPILTEETLSAGLAEIFRSNPDKPAKLGDKWKREFNRPIGGAPGTIKLDADYKYSESGTDGAKVTWSASGKYETGKPVDGSLFTISEVKWNVEEMSGSYLFDTMAGRLKSSSTKAKMNGTFKMSFDGKDQEWGVKESISTKITVSDKSLLKD